MAIIKKDSVDDSIIKELLEKYPPTENENGVCYKQELDYLTFETGFITNPVIRNLQAKYGAVVIAVIFYLRTEMCKNGWKVRIDKGTYYDTLVYDCSHYCNLARDITSQIIYDLVVNHVMYAVQDKDVEEGCWLTCTQQIYNYEMACNNRQMSRRRQAKLRAKKNGDQEEVQNVQEKEQEQKKEPQEQKQEQRSGKTITDNNVEQQQANMTYSVDDTMEENPFGF